MGFFFVRLKPPAERRLPIDAYIQKFMGKLMAVPNGMTFLQAVPV